MYNFLIATGAATLIGILAGVGLGGWTYGIIPALLVLLGGYFILLRRSIKKVEVISARVGQIMTAAERQSRGQARNPRAAKQSISRAIDQSIAELRKGYDIGQWQWGVRSQLDAQIGYYNGLATSAGAVSRTVGPVGFGSLYAAVMVPALRTRFALASHVPFALLVCVCVSAVLLVGRRPAHSRRAEA